MVATNISNELLLAVLHTDINYAELKQIVYDSVTGSFAGDETKKLRVALDDRYRRFEQNWAQNLTGAAE